MHCTAKHVLTATIRTVKSCTYRTIELDLDLDLEWTPTGPRLLCYIFRSSLPTYTGPSLNLTTPHPGGPHTTYLTNLTYLALPTWLQSTHHLQSFPSLSTKLLLNFHSSTPNQLLPAAFHFTLTAQLQSETTYLSLYIFVEVRETFASLRSHVPTTTAVSLITFTSSRTHLSRPNRGSKVSYQGPAQTLTRSVPRKSPD